VKSESCLGPLFACAWLGCFYKYEGDKMLNVRSECRGFSLIELITVIVVIGLLSIIAIPNIRSWIPNIRLNNASRDFYGLMMKAKGEAAKRNSICTVIFNQTVGTTNYQYVLIEDNSQLVGRVSEYDAGEPLIVGLEALPGNVFLDTTKGGGDGLSFPVNDDGRSFISFRPTAIPTGNNGAGFASGTLFLTNSNNKTKEIIVGQSGNIRIE